MKRKSSAKGRTPWRIQESNGSLWIYIRINVHKDLKDYLETLDVFCFWDCHGATTRFGNKAVSFCNLLCGFELKLLWLGKKRQKRHCPGVWNFQSWDKHTTCRKGFKILRAGIWKWRFCCSIEQVAKGLYIVSHNFTQQRIATNTTCIHSHVSTHISKTKQIVVYATKECVGACERARGRKKTVGGFFFVCVFACVCVCVWETGERERERWRERERERERDCGRKCVWVCVCVWERECGREKGETETERKQGKRMFDKRVCAFVCVFWFGCHILMKEGGCCCRL